MATAEAIQALEQVPMFSELSKRDRKSIGAWLKQLEYSPGQVVLTEGESGIGFFVISFGSASVYVDGEKVATLRVGDTFGEAALLNRRSTRTATVIAETDMQAYAMTAWNFNWMIDTFPEVGAAISRSLARQVQASAA